MIMPANNTHWLVHYWAGRFGSVGHLYGPGRRTPPFPHLPYALDNGAYGAYTNGTEWDAAAFVKHLEYYAWCQLKPMWVVVPDVVADKTATIAKYNEWAPIIKETYGLKVACAVQDGMCPADLNWLKIYPDVVFIGGTTEWKWASLRLWCGSHQHVHVGRVNTASQLELCSRAGVKSCDGTGWFRGRSEQIAELGHFLRSQSGCKDETAIDRMVYHSRTKNALQGGLLEVHG